MFSGFEPHKDMFWDKAPETVSLIPPVEVEVLEAGTFACYTKMTQEKEHIIASFLLSHFIVMDGISLLTWCG